MIEGVELPRDYMARCAQCGTRGIFAYRAELVAGSEHLRFIGGEFRDEDTARRWDDRPGNLLEWWSFPDWAAAEAWLYGGNGWELGRRRAGEA